MPSATIDIVQTKNSHAYAQACLVTPHPMNAAVQSTIDRLDLEKHDEGGYFTETDRDPLKIPNPFKGSPAYPNASSQDEADSDTRNAMTTIHYYLSPDRPVGRWHRNKARTVHTLHRGRGRYFIIDPKNIDSSTGHAKVTSFIVGHDIEHDEKLQWIVDGNKFKATCLLPDANSHGSEGGLLISETVVPGFELSDHDFLTNDELVRLLGKGEATDALKWLLREND